MSLVFVVRNKKLFPADPVTQRRLVTLGDLEDISEFTIEVDGSEPPVWEKVTMTYEDFAAAATTSTATVFTLPEAGAVHAVYMKHSESFTGGSISAYTISVGVAGSATKYAGAFNVFQAVGATAHQSTGTFGVESLTDEVDLIATATSTSANLSAATAGEVDIHILVSRLEK